MGIHAKDLLNDLKWHHHALDRALIHYRHRGAAAGAKRRGRRRGPQDALSVDDEVAVAGSEIHELGHSFFVLRREGPGSSSIPYHRILRVELDGRVIWARQPAAR